MISEMAPTYALSYMYTGIETQVQRAPLPDLTLFVARGSVPA